MSRTAVAGNVTPLFWPLSLNSRWKMLSSKLSSFIFVQLLVLDWYAAVLCLFRTAWSWWHVLTVVVLTCVDNGICHSVFKYSAWSIVIYLIIVDDWLENYVVYVSEVIWLILCTQRRRLYGKLRHRAIYIYIKTDFISSSFRYCLFYPNFLPSWYLIIYRNLFMFTVNFTSSVE